MERYQLDLIGLTSTHSVGFGTEVLERGWTLSYSGVDHGERHQAGVGILTSHRLSVSMLEVSLVGERVASLWPQITGGKVLTVV